MRAEVEVIDEITEETACSLSESERQKKIATLEKLEIQIRDGLSDELHPIHQFVFNSQKDIFQMWSSTLKQKYYLGVYKDPIYTISTYIKKQIGKMTDLSLEKKENLYRNVERSLTEEFKDPEKVHGGDNLSPENTSGLEKIKQSFLYKQLETLKQYHQQFTEIIETMQKSFEHKKFGEQIFKDFENTIEWREIAAFCSTIAALIEPIAQTKEQTENLDRALGKYTTLQAIRDDLNMRESADTFRKAMFLLIGADELYRPWAYKFGISPRQNQRVRERLEHWPKKDVKTVIQKVLGSYLCPNCSFNLVTKKKNIDLTDETIFMQYKLKDNTTYKIPDELKNKKYTPLQIAERVFKKHLKLVPVAKN